MIFHPRKRIEPHLMEALDVLRIELASVTGRLRMSNR
jgi:hypothetical protein